MGNYNSEYEIYYNSIANKGRVNNNLKKPSGSLKNFFSKERIIRRVEQELIGGLCLFLFLLFCKSNILTQCRYIYSYSKSFIRCDLDVKAIQETYLSDLQTKAVYLYEKIKTDLNAGSKGAEKKL